MAKLKEFREQNPEYDDMSDDELTRALHRKFYADMDLEEFAAKMRGDPMPTAPSKTVPRLQDNIREPAKPRNLAQGISSFFSAQGKADDPNLGEFGYASIPEEKDQRFEAVVPVVGDAAAAMVNTLPQGTRNWLGATQKAFSVGAGAFANTNEMQRAQIIAKNVPTSEFMRDSYGNVLVRYRNDQPWTFLNKPGVTAGHAQDAVGEIVKFSTAAEFVPFLNPAAKKAAGAAGEAAGAAGEVAKRTFGDVAKRVGGKMLRAGANAAAITAGGQAATIPLGAQGVEAGDVAAAAAYGAGFEGVGTAIGAGFKAAPGAARAAGRFVDDLLPGGAQRAAERQQMLDGLTDGFQSLKAAIDASARQQASDAARAQGQAAGLIGDALEQHVARTEVQAAAQIADEIDKASPDEISRIAETFGIKLSKSQATGDQVGLTWLHDAAVGTYGPVAQRAAEAFMKKQALSAPLMVDFVIPGGAQTILDPPSAVGAARAAMGAAQQATKEAERPAWSQFRQASGRGQSYDVTPGGSPGGVQTVLDRVEKTLVAEGEMVRPIDPVTGAPSERPMWMPGRNDRLSQTENILNRFRIMASLDRNQLPVNDVQRMINLKRSIDDAYDLAKTDTDRGFLAMMGSEVRSWLRNDLRARGAETTADVLENALGISERLHTNFRDNRIIRGMLHPEAPMTDKQVVESLFGGGDQGARIGGEAVQALETMREVLGPTSPEWQGLRAAALRRMTDGLERAAETGQQQRYLSAYNTVSAMLKNNREALAVLFSPEEIARLQQMRLVLSHLVPPAKSATQPSRSGRVAQIAMERMGATLSAIVANLKQVPVASTAINFAEDLGNTARVQTEIMGVQPAPRPSYSLSQALFEAMAASGRPPVLPGISGAAGTAYGKQQLNEGPSQ